MTPTRSTAQRIRLASGPQTPASADTSASAAARRHQPASRGDADRWPSLATLGLTRTALAERLSSIGGSDANTILSGNGERIVRLWREKRGLIEPEDLSDNLPVMLGCWTESFNRQWYEKLTGEAVSEVGAWHACSVRPWRTATLDGFVEAKEAVFEAKHTSAFAKPEEILARYMPQLQHNMAVLKAERAVLSVIYGNSRWEVYDVASDWMYQEDLLEAETRFIHCVRTGEPPAICVVDHVPRPIGVREVCLDGNNAWAAAAADWLANRAAAKVHATAAAALRELIGPDVACAFGHGIEARRNKAGAVTIAVAS